MVNIFAFKTFCSVGVLSITFWGKFLSDFKLEKQTNNQTSIFDERVGVLNQYLIKFHTFLFLFKNLATTLQINYTLIH